MESQTKFDYESLAFTKLSHSQWTDYFLSVPIDDSELDAITREIDIIKPEVRKLLSSKGDDETSKRKVLLIQSLLSLGLAFHFENEIKDILEDAFRRIDDITGDENDLSTISIMFRVFRTYGHNLPSSVFKRFTGDDGKFERSLTEDAKGILSLYEAAHLGTTTDYILDEALEFTSSHLKSLLVGGMCRPHILRLIRNTLYLPQRWNMEAVIAREYISFYEQEEDHDKMLLRLAKLNFKLLQLHYIKELKTFIKWWMELGLTSKWPSQFRERIVEAWLAGLMMYFEPQFSGGRVIAAKFNYLLTILDDACDHYFSIPELTRLVDCVERWNHDGIHTLEDISRIIFKLALDVFDDIGRGVRSKGCSYYLKEMLEELKILVRANLDLVKWARGNQLPSFEEHVEVGGIALTTYATLMYSFVGMGEAVGKEAYEWVRSRPRLIKSLAAKGRLMDDITDFESDMSNGFAANAINYYMKQFVVTKEEAILECQKMVVDINKIVNEELLKTTTVPRRVLKQALNFGRLLEVLYTKSDDIYNCSEGKLKEYIVTLLIDPIHL
ncbi:terpenoid synthase 13 [Arabidopsis thaliana]|uniref:(Z)-gamma-bisabolene synthase 2 n=1 Tax=Arabidopsis thaliana TaxID=3702 RepID=GBIS2_ARATH|nr:terpenoid synthase 13 [Arabidopsis thaliana]Q9T0K1.2 RecName: Full=(Z)-gamma-bisabolene synthase 2; AltName: Full=Terpenoid synthase 13; Short=AtTPS13 [Arabidopsis thaliana]AEE83260.1 terpenoid synthase 13 [Arabidopsis thaliana]|eukprot:NP_193066.4 terpenoid synthase 13 [Arabidopsis thaliana]